MKKDPEQEANEKNLNYVFRGGGWGNNVEYLIAPYRLKYVPDYRVRDIGLRLVRNVASKERG